MFLLASTAATNLRLLADETHAALVPPSPLSPDEALRQFELHPDLRIELAAAEPQVIDPVAIRFDEDGRMWVVEMRDYPDGPAPGQPPLSRIRVLEDRDGDGRYETSRTFADQLLFATGIQPWRGGVIVTLAGEVAWLKDTDGDGTADQRETWFTGFVSENPQLRANHPTFALDNHIYIANGLRGGDVIARREEWSAGAKPVSISGMDFRFDPRTGRYEAVSGLGQFGLTFDDFGRRFVCSNRNPCRHVVLEDRYLKRNPQLAVAGVMEDVSPAAEESRVYAISRTWTTSTLHVGQFTAACGVTIYRGNLLPEEFHGNSFTCEPTGNLVHRDVLEPHGATFRSRPSREGVEFLASRDEWFRPVNLANGPDGALYVVDMYRAVIEHPQFMPDELKQRPDLRRGDDRGRIYRIVPRETQAPVAGNAENGTRGRTRRRPRLSQATADELVNLLAHPNAWQRETAQRLLIERRDTSGARALQELAAEGETPEARIHALWTLDGLDLLEPGLLAPLLADHRMDPRVFEHVLRLAEPWLNDAGRTAALVQGSGDIEQLLTRAADSNDGQVRFQTALLLGELPPEVREQDWVPARLAGLATRPGVDAWTRMAVLTSVANPGRLLECALRPDPVVVSTVDPAARRETLQKAAELVGSGQADLAPVFGVLRGDSDSLEELRARMAALRGLGQGLRRRGQRLPAEMLKLPEDSRRLPKAIFAEAIQVALSGEIDAEIRTEAVELLQFAEYADAAPVLQHLASDASVAGLQLEAITSLATFREPETGPFLLDGFDSQTPAVRRAVLDALLADAGRTRYLLAEIEAGRFDARELDPARVTRLTTHGNAEIQAQAKSLLETGMDGDRQEVLRTYHEALFGQRRLYAQADAVQGRAVFEKNCVTCHRIGDLGVNVAPDIADSRVRQPEQLLTDILDPNRAVDSNYFSYTIITTGGITHAGVVASETATSVTLRQPEDKSITLLRDQIEEMRSNRISLMPVGLEKTINPEEMADLVSFIKNWRYLDGRVPLK